MNLQRPATLTAWLLATAFVCAAGTVYAQPNQAAANAKPAAASPAADAAPAEPDTLILSDTLNYDDVKKESVFTGNVIMTRGLMTLKSDKLVMSEDAEGFQYGTATVNPGKLVHIRQENPEKFEVIEAEGVRGEYDGKKEELVMIGKAVLTRYVCGKPFDNVKGQRVVYKQKTETYEAYGGPDSAAAGGRVRSLASPRAKVDAAAAECRKKSAGSPAPSKASQ
jgi:lipopolysaccharide export system protein LptA